MKCRVAAIAADAREIVELRVAELRDPRIPARRRDLGEPFRESLPMIVAHISPHESRKLVGPVHWFLFAVAVGGAGLKALTRGALARVCEVNPETIRYYERRGLLPSPERTPANYRVYTSETVRRVRFIRRAQGLGFTLAEIQDLLSLRAAPRSRCGEVLAATQAKIRSIDEKIEDLCAMKKALTGLAARCERSEPTSACPILEALDARVATPTTKGDS